MSDNMTDEFTAFERRIWLLKFILKNPIFSLKAFWSDLEEGY